MKDLSKTEKTFFSRFKSPIDNPIISGLIKVASHPITGIVFRGVAIGLAVSNPISLSLVIGSQITCIGIDSSREYRSKRLEERDKLVDHYGIMVKRLDAALEKLEKDPKERELIRSRFNKPQEKQEHEKQPRKGLEKGAWQYRIARFIEWGAAVIMDSISTHGIALAKYLPIDIVPELFTMGRTSEAVGTYSKRKKALEENRVLRESIIEKAKKLNIPSYIAKA